MPAGNELIAARRIDFAERIDGVVALLIAVARARKLMQGRAFLSTSRFHATAVEEFDIINGGRRLGPGAEVQTSYLESGENAPEGTTKVWILNCGIYPDITEFEARGRTGHMRICVFRRILASNLTLFWLLSCDFNDVFG